MGDGRVAIGMATLARGREERIALAAARAEELPFEDAPFDALTFTHLLRYVAEPTATLVELARLVRPGGVVASLDFDVPGSPAS
jgi:demethylmenaquinone methyltransferase/2-methoxy-6-polyprenyl-1,4-benzoquinol methylase